MMNIVIAITIITDQISLCFQLLFSYKSTQLLIVIFLLIVQCHMLHLCVINCHLVVICNLYLFIVSVIDIRY